MLALRGQLFGPEEALARGIFHELAEPDDVLPRATEVARELATAPAAVYGQTKHQLRGAAIEDMRARLAADPLLSGWVE
jgi:enoyl-CoA hydratase/carnithine racemase